MALLKKRKSRKTGEELSVVQPTPDQVIERRGTCELSDEFLQGFLRNVQTVAMKSIDLFFQGREMYCGGDIGEDQLHCTAYVSMVMNYDIGTSVDIAYGSLDRNGMAGQEEMQQQFVMKMLNSCAGMGIPKCFAGGLLLMYMELCLGLDLREVQENAGLAA